ncbi:MAG: F0F1 ATP synthase subunit A [Clostridia bacterium]|nr:F0F1 ATP synthase subunit A [Clostridia bacterium]
MVLPIVAGIVLNVLTKPVSEGVSITGARIFFTIPMPLQDLPVTEAQINSALVMITLLFFCLYLTHGLTEKCERKRQHLAELIVEKVDALVTENMGDYFIGFAPFIIAVIALSAFSSLLSLCGLFPPTSDINVVGGWAVLVFGLITYYKLKCGPLNYLKGFTEPVAVLTPINIVSELATPVSMAFRHYGNVLSGSVISVLLATALSGLSSLLLSWLPGFLADIPLFQIGIPAVLSIYFDIFSGCLQAFIFAMLTMVYVGGGFDLDLYKQRKARKAQKIKTNSMEE